MADVQCRMIDDQGQSYEAAIAFSDRPPWKVVLRSHAVGKLKASGEDLFDCLCQVRARLEQSGLRLLCAGSRVDVYPSPMARAMGGGRKAYQLKMNNQAQMADLVDIFEPASPESVGSMAEQRDYHRRWLDSLQSQS